MHLSLCFRAAHTPLALPCLVFQWSDSSLDLYSLCACEIVGGGHSGLGRCSPSMSGVSWGLWVALVGVQSPREAWAALR